MVQLSSIWQLSQLPPRQTKLVCCGSIWGAGLDINKKTEIFIRFQLVSNEIIKNRNRRLQGQWGEFVHFIVIIPIETSHYSQTLGFAWFIFYFSDRKELWDIFDSDCVYRDYICNNAEPEREYSWESHPAVKAWCDSCVGGGSTGEGQTSLVKRQLTEQQHNIMLPKNYSLRKILVLFSFFEIYCTRVGNSERFSQGKPRVFV